MSACRNGRDEWIRQKKLRRFHMPQAIFPADIEIATNRNLQYQFVGHFVFSKFSSDKDNTEYLGRIGRFGSKFNVKRTKLVDGDRFHEICPKAFPCKSRRTLRKFSCLQLCSAKIE